MAMSPSSFSLQLQSPSIPNPFPIPIAVSRIGQKSTSGLSKSISPRKSSHVLLSQSMRSQVKLSKSKSIQSSKFAQSTIPSFKLGQLSGQSKSPSPSPNPSPSPSVRFPIKSPNPSPRPSPKLLSSNTSVILSKMSPSPSLISSKKPPSPILSMPSPQLIRFLGSSWSWRSSLTSACSPTLFAATATVDRITSNTIDLTFMLDLYDVP
mmetsp:Transcript_18170/g.44967  ORF Transcript_18170/g.44967 Transcript_18170/m.44967 type:complete len:208 (+) Transcript_18170:1142-1765(+)